MRPGWRFWALFCRVYPLFIRLCVPKISTVISWLSTTMTSRHRRGCCPDGTLRLLALTLLAYVPDGDGICLLEVPENGLHSGAVEAVFKAFSAVAQHEDRARTQILTTTHSPVVFDLADPEHLLCFVTTETGATEIISGADRGAG